jgi:hypothetical protein
MPSRSTRLDEARNEECAAYVGLVHADGVDVGDGHARALSEHDCRSLEVALAYLHGVAGVDRGYQSERVAVAVGVEEHVQTPRPR